MIQRGAGWAKALPQILTNYLFIFPSEKLNRYLDRQMMRLDRKYNFVGLVKTETKMVTGCLIMMTIRHICIR